MISAAKPKVYLARNIAANADHSKERARSMDYLKFETLMNEMEPIARSRDIHPSHSAPLSQSIDRITARGYQEGDNGPPGVLYTEARKVVMALPRTPSSNLRISGSCDHCRSNFVIFYA